MKTSPQDWILWDKSEPLPFSGGVSFHIRSILPASVKNEFGLVLGFGTGEQQITVTGDGEIHFACKSDIWLRPSSRVQERIQRSTEIFTSLDRPAPMSPEMLAIQRMMRKNELDREMDRREMEKRYHDLNKPKRHAEKQSQSDARKVSADEAETLRADPGGSGDNASDKAKPTNGADDDNAGGHAATAD